MKIVTIRVILILAGLLLLTAPLSVQAKDSALPGTSWVLSSLNSQLPVPGTTVTLEFNADGTATGSDGCNRFSTAYTANGSSLSFEQPAAATMMACPEPVANQATAFMETLASVDKYQVRHNQLTLLQGRTVVATFVSSDQSLAGTTWLVTGYNNGQDAVVSPLVGTDITVLFDESNQITGNGGCNDFFALYQTSDGAITVDEVGATRRACTSPRGVMEQEREFFTALESAATYTVQGDLLEMRNDEDAIAVHMVRELVLPIPTPAPAAATGRVTAPNGVNVRTGPGTNFPVIGTAPFGTEGEIIGRSADGRWWVVSVPSAPGGSGWVSADFVAARGANNVPIVAAPAPPVYIPPPPPPPTPVPAPTATPGPQMSLSADQTTINQGECTTIRWSVENVQAVWVYPQGSPYQQYPRTGQGSEQVCPATTTTYEMRVLLRDGSVVTRQVTVNVVPAASQNSLNGTTWQVTGYNNGRNAVTSPLVGTTLTTSFEGEQISGNAGCNNYTGSYFVSGSNISIGALGTGMMMCAEPAGVMEQENEFLAALRSSVTFRFNGNQLEFRAGDGTASVFFIRLQ